MELRMYGLVPYNISPIQQGIQYGHGVVEYGLQNFNDKEYQDWALLYKTFIILNGGTTNNNIDKLGTLNKHANYLDSLGIKTSKFYEPDLGDQLTSVCFIVNEKVFNKTLYPDYIFNYSLKEEKIWSDEYQGWIIENDYKNWKLIFNESEEITLKIIKLRQFLSPLRLA